MIKLYGAASPNVYKVSIMLEETGLAYEPVYVDVFNQQQDDPEFRRISPASKVPAILDEDGPGGRPLALSESGAILLYLAEKSGTLLPADPATRAEVVQWVMIQMASMGPMFGQYLHFLFFAPQEAYGLQRYGAQARHVLALYEERLEGREFVVGDAYSIADVAILPWIRRSGEVFPWLTENGVGATFPNLGRWLDAALARPATQRGFARLDAAVGDATAKSFDNASGQGLDRFLLREGPAR